MDRLGSLRPAEPAIMVLGGTLGLGDGPGPGDGLVAPARRLGDERGLVAVDPRPRRVVWRGMEQRGRQDRVHRRVGERPERGRGPLGAGHDHRVAEGRGQRPTPGDQPLWEQPRAMPPVDVPDPVDLRPVLVRHVGPGGGAHSSESRSMRRGTGPFQGLSGRPASPQTSTTAGAGAAITGAPQASASSGGRPKPS